jgi:beta-galactosidase
MDDAPPKSQTVSHLSEQGSEEEGRPAPNERFRTSPKDVAIGLARFQTGIFLYQISRTCVAADVLIMRLLLFSSTRRQFLQTASIVTGGALIPAPLRAVAMSVQTPEGVDFSGHRVDTAWQFRKGPTDGIWEVWRAEGDLLWQSTTLPHCFNDSDACDPDQPYFRGQGWYRTRVQVANPFAGGRTLLHFQGAGQTTTLWVGSKLIGVHKGGYDEFVFDITEAVHELPVSETKQGVPIAVLCDNGPDLDRVPSDLSDFCLYGGLYRHVNLVYLPSLAPQTVHVLPRLAEDGSAAVSVKARLYNPTNCTSSCSVSIEITDPKGQRIHSHSKTVSSWDGFQQLADFRVALPQLWSPESPSLYRCRMTVSNPTGQSSVEERFGIRHYEFVEHGPFKLNGKRVLLRGTQRHADHAGLAAAMSDDLIRQEMQLIREMGANFIRLGHYQQDRLVLDLCDELGLMVWEEVPWCRAGIGSAAFQQNAKDMLSHMIEQHYNHPSIILWGLGNEDDWPTEYPCVDEHAIRKFMTELRDLAHSLDGSRLTSFRRCDFARDIPDVYSPSIWAGWYRGKYREYEKTLLTERERVKRFIHIEWGADSQAGRHSEDPEVMLTDVPTGTGTDERGLDYLKTGGEVRVSRDGDWSETYACNLFDWHLKTQEKLDWFTGSAQWIFKDFASPLRGDNDIPHINQKGVVERDLTKKESYFVFQSYWAETPMVHIYGHSWPVRWGKPGEQRDVNVYSNCDYAELFLNGRSVGTKQRNSQDFPAAGLRWKLEFASGLNKLNVVASKGGATVRDEIEFTYQTTPWGKPAELRLFEKERNKDIVTVGATIHDAKGVHCLDSRNVVRFSLAGEGKLIDNLGTARGSRELQLYNGRAEISLRYKTGSTVGVACKGLPAAFLKLS